MPRADPRSRACWKPQIKAFWWACVGFKPDFFMSMRILHASGTASGWLRHADTMARKGAAPGR
eukprot:scaffold535_cov260-Pinguiococcus_pyrenoidosus.AAC.7